MKKLFVPILAMLFIGLLFSSCNKDSVIQNNEIAQDEQADFEGKSIEDLSETFFQNNPDLENQQNKVVEMTKTFYASFGVSKEFSSKKPCHIQPIYAYGIDGIAYYEIWFTEDNKTVEGWLLISATDKDYPIVNFSMGKPYSKSLVAKGIKGAKVYRFGVSYFALEDNGHKVADYGVLPNRIGNADSDASGFGDSKNGDNEAASNDLVEGVDFFSIDDYETLKAVFPQNYFSSNRKQGAVQMERLLNQEGTARAYTYRWVPGQQCYFTQIAANTSANWKSCWSGCNNNAWTNVYGWWDRNKAKANLIPTTSTGETSPIYRTTAARQASVDPVQMNIASRCGTYCNDGGGWTYWSRMHDGRTYASSKGYGYNYQYRWCNSDGCHVDLANILTESIANRYEPLVIGANSHMYVGFGWAQNPSDTQATWAYCYPGWSTNGSDDVWIWWKDFNATTRITVY